MSDPCAYTNTKCRYSAHKKSKIVCEFKSSSDAEREAILAEHSMSLAEMNELIEKHDRGGNAALKVRMSGKRAA